MRYIQYIKINNFKVFGSEVSIDLEDTTVLIGPNNAGKTSVIQALTLWQLGIRVFVDGKTDLETDGRLKKKGKWDSTSGISLSKDDITQVPIVDTRQLFFKGIIMHGKERVRLSITIGLLVNGKTEDCTVEFKYFKSEIVYCYLSERLTIDMDLLRAAKEVEVNLLYPMSGLNREETVLQEGAIRKQIGRGTTAGLLRNICYYLHANSLEDWKVLVKWMNELFYIDLREPRRLSSDDLVLTYNYVDKSIKVEKDLDILQAGRGQLQMLLILAFVIWRKKSIILIDEPDAHLEVLRQNQVFEVLKSIALKNECQIVIATHSEVIMNEADSLVFLINGNMIALDKEKQAKNIKSALRDYGVEHYFKAQIHKRVLYLEGTTDKQNLIEIATLMKHPVVAVLKDRIFVYYTQSPDASHPEYITQAGNYDANYQKHFNAVVSCVDGFKGIALLDSDGSPKESQEEKNGLTIRYWRRYELENYFLNPTSILAYTQNFFEKLEGQMFAIGLQKKFVDFFNQVFLFERIFDKNERTIALYLKSEPETQEVLYQNASSNKKVSKLLDETFQQYAEQEKLLLLRKGEFYKIIPFVKPEMLEKEVSERLDELYSVLKSKD